MSGQREGATVTLAATAWLGTCSFCGAGPLPTVQSEVHEDIRICESCCDVTICAFLNRRKYLASSKRKGRNHLACAERRLYLARIERDQARDTVRRAKENLRLARQALREAE